MKKPSVVYIRRNRVPVEMPQPVTPVDAIEASPASEVRLRGWRGLRGQVEAEFRQRGAKVFPVDTLVTARNERRTVE